MSKKTSTPTAENLLFASTIVQQLDGLAVRRKEWETTDYKKANDGLYALLADCLSVYQARFVKGLGLGGVRGADFLVRLCQRRLNIEPPCRFNSEPGRVANS